MARYPAARWRPIPATHRQPRIRPRAAVAHSAAGRGSLHGWWLNPAARGLESHFWVSFAGLVEQYVDTDIRADAQGAANGFAVSFETESSVQATERWAVAQAVAIVKLLVWLCRTHGIPARIMVSPTGTGLSWHVQWGAPGPWTKVRGKTCPGPARIAQYQREIVPQVARLLAAAGPLPPPTVPDMEELTVAQIDTLLAELKALRGEVAGAKAEANAARAAAITAVGEAAAAHRYARQAYAYGRANALALPNGPAIVATAGEIDRANQAADERARRGEGR